MKRLVLLPILAAVFVSGFLFTGLAASDFPSLDIDGEPRGLAPEAGADDLG